MYYLHYNFFCKSCNTEMWLIMPEFVESERFRIMKYENFMDDLKSCPLSRTALLYRNIIYLSSWFYMIIRLFLYYIKGCAAFQYAGIFISQTAQLILKQVSSFSPCAHQQQSGILVILQFIQLSKINPVGARKNGNRMRID